MLKSILWYVKFVVCLVLKTPQLKKAEKILAEEGQEAFDHYCYPIVSAWAEARLRDSGAKVTVIGAEKLPRDRNVLFVSNHQSDFDIALFLARVPKEKGFVAKIEMERVPFLSDWMRNIHCVFMDRKDMKQSLSVILEGIKLLKAGYSLVVFPEGTRSKGPKPSEFKPGSLKLATKSKAPVVPVTIDGSYKIMEGNHYRICPAEVKMILHEPIFVEAMTKEELAGLPARVEKIIRQPLEETYEKL